MIGYFDNQKKEYVIKDMYPLRPLLNYIWNEEIVVNLNQFGIGPSSSVNQGDLRRVVLDYRLVYIKDRDSGIYYAANRNFRQLNFERFETHVGLGYSRIFSTYQNIDFELTLSVPEKDFAEIMHIKIKNSDSKVRNLSIYPYVRPFVNTTWHIGYNQGEWDDDLQGLIFEHNGFNLENPYQTIFFKSDFLPKAYETTDDKFIGRYGSIEHPLALKNKSLSNFDTVSEENFACVFQYDFALKPGEEITINLVIGLCKERTDAIAIADKYLKPGYFEENLQRLDQVHEAYIEKMVVETPDEYLNTMTNVWLKRQVSLGKTWARVYGKGFRDVLQDCSCFASLDPETAKQKLLYTLKFQFTNGNTIRMYEPIEPHPYQDGAAWIPATVLAYLKETGDFDLLDEKVGYYGSDLQETVRDHMLRGLRYLYSEKGEHGLILWRGGDWNDSIDNAGMQGRGESVWLSIATIKASNEFIEILEEEGNQNEIITELKAEIEKLKAAILKNGWDGKYFIYGYDDYGNKVGSKDSVDAKIMLNPQTWAVLAGIFDVEDLHKLMDVVEERLKCDYGYLQCAPSMTARDPNIGRMSYFQPGVFENGSVYIHGVTFKIVADCLLGRGEKAYETIKILAYDNPLNPNSGVEPYAVSNMYYGPECVRKKGYAPQSWITGSAGWLYRGITQFLLGISPEFSGLKINPVFPQAWDKVKVSRLFRGSKYEIELIRSDVNKLVVNNQEIEGNIVPVYPENSVVQVKYYFKQHIF